MKSVVCLFLIFIAYVNAFCVYNDTADNSFFVRQMPRHTGGTYFSRFKHENMRPGDKQCCHFSTHDCNTTGDKNTVLELAFQASYGGVAKDYMFTVTLPAGGALVLSGKGAETAKVTVWDPDGNLYRHEYQVNPRAILLN